MPITHLKHSTKPDSTDASKIQPSDWNAIHDTSNFFVDGEAPVGVIDGYNNSFNLLATPNPSSSLMLFVNGVLQFPNVAYTIVGNAIVFADAYVPQTGYLLRAYYRKG